MGMEMIVQSVPVRFGGERRVVDDAEQRAFNAGLYESMQQIHRVAASAAARVVGDIGESVRLEARVARNRERRLHGVLERCELRDRKSTRLNSSHIPLSRMPSS